MIASIDSFYYYDLIDYCSYYQLILFFPKSAPIYNCELLLDRLLQLL
uniref:Uncharacterized protein n=1 Tax=Arundo donax TaxID=35708 RepID=A0A0A9FG02_ARUDO